MQKEDIIDWQDLVPSDYHLFSPMKEGLRGKHHAGDEEVKTAVMKWLKEYSTEFYEAGIHALIRRMPFQQLLHWGVGEGITPVLLRY